ncbi:MAG: tRNA lysidine(34) synthetase TilS [Pseudomonadales bacterium]|nr:tRNA lysidine(34) synthetase TilS [Pseudomonadales bacterium]
MDVLAALQSFLQGRLPSVQGRLVVGWSGGMDSTALLAGLLSLRTLEWPPLVAVHVHHGLQAEADAWAEHCQQCGTAWDVPVQVIRVQVPAGASVEAMARQARRQAFASVLQEGDVLLLAHHADDQAETLLFRLCRGTGLDGLRGMDEDTCWLHQQRRLRLWRPWLSLRRAWIAEWMAQQDRPWIEDPSNQHTYFARNFLRHEVLPSLEQRWPATIEHLGSLARECQDVLSQLDAWDRDLLQSVGFGNTVSVASLQALPEQSRARVLRLWLKDKGLPRPGRHLMQRLCTEFLAVTGGTAPLLTWSGVEVCRFRGQLHAGWQLPDLKDFNVSWDMQQPLPLPGQRRLVAEQVQGRGLRQPPSGYVWVRGRQGGETMRIYQHGPRQEIKGLMQSWAIPPKYRYRCPLVFVGEDVACVPGFAVAESHAAGVDEVGYDLIVMSER